MFRKSIPQVLVPFGCLALGALLGRAVVDPGADARKANPHPEGYVDPPAVAEASMPEECEETQVAGVCCDYGPLGCAEVYGTECPEGATPRKCPCSPYHLIQAVCEASAVEGEPAAGETGT
jgi:hypothetical protein